MISCNAVLVRPHPKCPKFFQFLEEEDFMSCTVEKKKELTALQESSIKSQEYKKLCHAIASSASDQGPVFQADDEDFGSDDDAESDADIPRGLKLLMGKKKTFKKKHEQTEEASPAKTNDSKQLAVVESTSELAGDKKSDILRKAAKMHSFLLKSVPKASGGDLKDLKKKLSDISNKITDDNTSGCKLLLKQSCALWKKLNKDA